MHLLIGGELGRGPRLDRSRRSGSWSSDGDCVERGYLLIPAAFGRRRRRPRAAAAARRGGDGGRRALRRPRPVRARAPPAGPVPRDEPAASTEGLALLDEAMVAVTAGEVSPSPTRHRLLRVIMACQRAYELRRAQEWTAALTRWCERQPDMVAFTGRCLVHRAEIMQLHGAWTDALEEARPAARAAPRRAPRRALGEAAYQRGELHRLRGELERAEEATARRPHGREPQPGLALLRLAQGDRCGARRDPPRAGRDDRPGRARRPAAGRASRSCSPRATSTPRARACDELAELAERRREAVVLRRSRQQRGRGRARRGRRAGGAAARCAGLGRLAGPRGAVRGGARARADRRTPAARLATTTPPRSSSRPPTRVRARSARRRTWRASTRSPARSATPRRGADRARAPGAAPVAAGRRTRRSRTSSSSASTRSTATSATSSPSSASRRAPPPRRSPTSTSWSG